MRETTIACLAAALLACAAAYAADDIPLADFDGKDYGEWKVEGEAFGPGPAHGTLKRQNPVTGFLGKGLVNTYYKGDRTVGALTSPVFTIQRKFINFLVAGGPHEGATCINLIVDGKPVRTTTGANGRPHGTERLDWATWDVSKFMGKQARIRIIDDYTGGWGHINVDHICQSDSPKSKRIITRYTGDLIIDDFERESYAPWRVEGDAFGAGPTSTEVANQRRLSGYRGRRFAYSRTQHDRQTGALTSPAFTIERRYISFLVGGGNWLGMTCVELLVDGKVVRWASGNDDDRLIWSTWDVAGLQGKAAQIRIADRCKGLFGHVAADHFVQSDRPKSREIRGAPEAERRRGLGALAMHGVDDIIFAERAQDPDGHWYANFSYWSSNPKRTLYHNGGKLCRMNLRTGKVATFIDDPKGGVRDPQVHYDGEKILFSYRKGGQPFYHLYEINIDGSGLRQLTDGPFDDIEPTYLPDGGIAFCSSRCNRMVNCYFVRVATVYRCDADGSNIRQLSSNIEQDNTPWPLPDGRLIHQRWEYIDRSQVCYHHLWTMNPDGTDQMVYYGNLHPSTVMIDAKPIPGTDRVVAAFCPGHGRREHAGWITIVDPGCGPDDRPSARRIGVGKFYRDPYPLSEDCFIVAGSTDLLVMDGQGQVAQFYDLPEADKVVGLRIHEPRPVRPRPRERVIPSRIQPQRRTGQVILTDVYEGRNMAGIKRGEIKKLLVLEALPKPVNFTGGWEPITFGGSFTLERIVGTVPVEDDGSANIELPALRSLFFVALDKHDVAVKRMQSFLTVQPGEVFSCVGCHEQRQQTPTPGKSYLKALSRRPSCITPIADMPDVIDFPRDIQPILDKHCVACHDYDATEKGGPRAGGVVLCADRGPMYSHSYYALSTHGQIRDGRNLAKSNYPPRAFGSAASPIMKMIDGSHHNVTVSPLERTLVMLWLDSAAAYPGTYAALGSGMVGGFGWGKRTRGVFKRRCGECHKGDLRLPSTPRDSLGIHYSGVIRAGDPRLRFMPHAVHDLSRPEKSLLLLAPLAKEAGGYGLPKPEKGKGHVAVFMSKTDPDYGTLLAAIRESKKQLDKIKRFDMPGFRPNRHYIREMQFYGVLPKSLKPADPIDPYATDRAYWRSLWYRPANSQGVRATSPSAAPAVH